MIINQKTNINQNLKKMKKHLLTLVLVLITHQIYSQSKINVNGFNEVILNSGIKVSLIQGESEFVTHNGTGCFLL
jgi:hypothetical protein